MLPRSDEADAIHIEDLELSVRVGVSEEERSQPQRLVVSIVLWPVGSFAHLQDQIVNTVDYAIVCQEITSLAARRSDKLIETLAEAIAFHLLAEHPIARVRIELRKFILPGVKHVAVVLTRERS
jgi:dihydroneopterin aldolase